MRKNIIVVSIVFGMLFTMNLNQAFGQLKVKGETGKVIIGQDRLEDPIEDMNQVLSASVFGREGFYNAGAKLAFGDFGRFDHWGWNVFVGEWGLLDSDQLWLHGKNGFHLTYGRGEQNYNLVSFDVNNSKVLYLNTEVVAHGLKIPTDSKIQQDVTKIEESFNRITKLQGITYKYKPYELNHSENINSERTTMTADTTLSETALQDTNALLKGESSEDKEKTDEAFFSQWGKDIDNYAPQKNGFDASQIKELFPELLETDKDGNTYVDYIGLIPVLVEAIKEQSYVMKAQSLKIKEMELSSEATLLDVSVTDSNNTTKSSRMVSDTTFSNILANAFLYQNTPNPFNTSTEIKYFLPEGSTNAYIYVFNLQGGLLLSYPLTVNGFGSIIINGSELNAGMYIYSLVIRGQQAETKRMILTK
jgi:hypothetical protein